MNELRVFNFNTLEIETIDTGSGIRFLARPVLEYLGYQNPAEAIRTHVDSDEVEKIYIPAKSNSYLFLTESGLYSLVLRSNKPEAKVFRKWVTQEVLPTIRKAGAYAVHKKTAVDVLADNLRVLELFHAPLHLAQIEAVKLTLKDTGVDFTPHLLLAPAQNSIPEAEEMLEPTELGKRLAIGSAIAVNNKLCSAGLQIRDQSGWVATEKGVGISVRHAWKAGNKSGYNLKWKVTEVKKLLKITENE